MPRDYEGELSAYRLEKAMEMLKSAELELSSGSYASANNRAYFAVFHAMRAVLALDNLDFKKHSGVISYFKQLYIKTGAFDKSLSKIIDSASEIRNKSDYDDFYVCSKKDSAQLVSDAQHFVAQVADYLKTKE